MTIEAVDTRARGLRNRSTDERRSLLALLGRLDWLLLLAVLGTVVYGVWSIDGITLHDPGGSAASRQALYAGVGLVGFVVAILVDPAVYRRWSRAIYLGLTGVMALVLVAGAATRGSRRWVDIGFFTFQPSEFGKVLLALFLAAFLSDRAKRLNEFRVPLPAIALAAGPIFLVFVQPDIGSALVYLAVLAAVLFVSGVRWLHLALIGTVALIGALTVLWLLPASGVNVLKPYQAARLTGFTHPSNDPNNPTSYNLTQSKRCRRGRIARPRDRRRHPDAARLPARACDRLRLRLARGAARFLRRRDPAAALPARRLAWAQDRHDLRATCSGRSPQRGSCSRFFPGVRERRHDDRDRADHGHPAPVRVRRRIVDDQQPDRDGDPAGDPRARRPPSTVRPVPLIGPKRVFLSALALSRESRLLAADHRPLVVSGARELVPLLAKELRAGGEPLAVREHGSPEGAIALVWIGEADDAVLRRASAARVPIVEPWSRQAQSLPSSSTTQPRTASKPGRGFPVQGDRQARSPTPSATRASGLAARLPVVREASRETS